MGSRWRKPDKSQRILMLYSNAKILDNYHVDLEVSTFLNERLDVMKNCGILHDEIFNVSSCD